MLVISPIDANQTGVHFCNYDDKTQEELDKILVTYKTVIIQVDTEINAYVISKLAFGSISLGLCTYNPEIAKILFMENTEAFIGLIEKDSFLYIDTQLEMFISFILLNFSVNSTCTINQWKMSYPGIKIYVYNVNTIGDVHRAISWNIDGILSERTGMIIQTLTDLRMDVTTILGKSVFSLDVSDETVIDIKSPRVDIRKRSRNRQKNKIIQ